MQSTIAELQTSIKKQGLPPSWIQLRTSISFPSLSLILSFLHAHRLPAVADTNVSAETQRAALQAALNAAEESLAIERRGFEAKLEKELALAKLEVTTAKAAQEKANKVRFEVQILACLLRTHRCCLVCWG